VTSALQCSGIIQNVKNVIAVRKEPTAVMPELEAVPVSKIYTPEINVTNVQKTTGNIQIVCNVIAAKREQVAVRKRLETALVDLALQEASVTGAPSCSGDIRTATYAAAVNLAPRDAIQTQRNANANQHTPEKDVTPVNTDGLATRVVIIKLICVI